MNLAALLATLAPIGLDEVTFPPHLLGAFRRKSITFCTGLTDERTIVYWFQSKSFTIDLRLPDGADTLLVERQGWIGDTVWDHATSALSWNIAHSYQPRDQWPEPAQLHFVGNSVIEFAPSGAYVEDWRQQASTGPLLGLRLVGVRDNESAEWEAVDGGLIVAGEHMAYAQSRMPRLDKALRAATSLEEAVADGSISAEQIESYEVSVATGGGTVTHSTQPHRLGQPIAAGEFANEGDGAIVFTRADGGQLRFRLDLYVPAFAFGTQTAATPEAREWMRRESGHLSRHAAVCR